VPLNMEKEKTEKVNRKTNNSGSNLLIIPVNRLKYKTIFVCGPDFMPDNIIAQRI
jgi:hypothetical protein